MEPIQFERAYRELVDYQRFRNILGGYGWPGKPVHSGAKTLYPNLLAEVAVSGLWLTTAAELAGVSPEIMAAVIEDNEPLSLLERFCFSHRCGCKLGYISSPVLQMVDPATNKGKRRRKELHDLLAQATELPDPATDVHGFRIYWRSRVEPVYNDLAAGVPVTYAAYGVACSRMREVLENVPKVRKERMKCSILP